MNPCIFFFLKNRNRLLAFYLTKKFLICFIVIKNICWIHRNMVSLSVCSEEYYIVRTQPLSFDYWEITSKLLEFHAKVFHFIWLIFYVSLSRMTLSRRLLSTCKRRCAFFHAVSFQRTVTTREFIKRQKLK